MNENDGEPDGKSYTLNVIGSELAKSFNHFSQQMSEASKNIGLVFQSLVEPYQNFQKLMISIFPSLTGIDRIGLSFEKLKKLEYRPFIECGLWLTPSMTPGIVTTIVEKYEQGKKRAIPAIVEGFYRRNNYEILRDAVSRWNSLEFFSPRMQIFKDALDAHIAGKWTLTIPTLLPHIEGIAGEILRANGLPIKNDVVIVPDGAKNCPSSVFRSFPLPEVSSIRYVLISSLLDYLERTLYEYKRFEDPKIRNLPKINRHAILHGYQVNYATRLNSLRCFLALDSLSMLEKKIPKLI